MISIVSLINDYTSRRTTDVERKAILTYVNESRSEFTKNVFKSTVDQNRSVRKAMAVYGNQVTTK